MTSLLSPIQREAFRAFVRLWEDYGMHRHRAHALIKDILDRDTVPHFGSLSEEQCRYVIRLLSHESLQNIVKQRGQDTGVCQVCGRELTDPASKAKGIGPECEKKFRAGATLESLL